MDAYRTASEVRQDRIAWATALLEGKPTSREMIAARIAVTPCELKVTPVEWLSTRLGLSGRAVDLLWLLAIAEMEPAVTKLAHAVGEISAMAVQRLFGLTGGELERLQQLGLIETASDPRVPQQRRSVRINDRVLEIVRGELRLDPELEGVATTRGRDDRGDADPALVRALAGTSPPVVIAIGPDGAGRATALGRAAGERGFGTLRVAVRELEPARRER